MDSEKRLGQAAPVLGAEPRGFVAVGACTVPAPRTRVPAHASDSETRISLATPKRCRQATRIQASVAPPPFTLAFPLPPLPPCCEQRLSRVQARRPSGNCLRQLPQPRAARNPVGGSRRGNLGGRGHPGGGSLGRGRGWCAWPRRPAACAAGRREPGPRKGEELAGAGKKCGGC